MFGCLFRCLSGLVGKVVAKSVKENRIDSGQGVDDEHFGFSQQRSRQELIFSNSAPSQTRFY